MVFIGDYLSLGLIIILFMFFFDSKAGIRHMPNTSVIFIFTLFMTALNAVTDLCTGFLMNHSSVPLWLNLLVNSLYFLTNIITTSAIALYLITQILKHTYSRRCMKNACIGLVSVFGIYLFVVIANIWTGWLFYFLEDGTYCRGPLNSFGYLITMAQMMLVLICFFRNRAIASRPMRRALLQIFPVIPLCILVQRIYPEIMLNSFILALADTVMFLTFMGQRQGVHSLTKLNDRHRFFTEVDRRISQSEPFQIFLINIKNCSSINQKYGNRFGDEVLYQFAFALEKLFGDSISFHMNGTVFTVIMRYTFQVTAEKQCGKLLDFLEQGIRCSDQLVDIDYVVSHYIATGHEKTSQDLFETMEYAVSKAHNTNQRYIQCSHEDGVEVARRRYLQERLKTIDRAHGYEVWFQPIQCLSSGEFCSMEALIRLREPDGKLISPAEFIPLAEQIGHISSITWFVLEETCRILKWSSELENVSVSINMPMTQLLEKGFVPRFTGIVDQAGIDHHRICIEFTERAILENYQQTIDIMNQLSQDGFRFYLDDFGTGYSNFNCLLQLPFQIIKLDACLVHPDKNKTQNNTMVPTLTRLFHEMDLIVIAEGVETMEEVRALAEQGIDRIQGFALARPMPVDALLRFYREHTL